MCCVSCAWNFPEWKFTLDMHAPAHAYMWCLFQNAMANQLKKCYVLLERILFKDVEYHGSR